MRLQLWLALRDVYPTGPLLQWEPPRRHVRSIDPLEASCLESTLPPARHLGHNDPPLLGRGHGDREKLRTFLVVTTEIGFSRYELHLCKPGSPGQSQVFVSELGREGPILREMMAWLTGSLESGDVEPWFNTWSQPVTPDVAALRAYGDALVESMDANDGPTQSLLQAAALLPEAAWASAALTADRAARRELLKRAVALRPGFTAALEDLSWEWSQSARPDLAMLTLSRLLAPERVRPSELLLAARMLDAGHSRDALHVIERMPPQWRETTAALRLEARARLEVGDPVGAQSAARSWTEAVPAATEAWLLRGDADRLMGDRAAADVAYSQALKRHSRLRADALARWSVLQLELGRPAAVAERLADDEEAPLVDDDTRLLALRAWSHWRNGDARRAAVDTARLAELEPRRIEHRRNLCVLALSAGMTEAPPEECGEPVFADLFGTLMEAVWLSRRPFRTPEEGAELDQLVERLAAAAPMTPDAIGAALRVLGPRASDEELAALQAQWQLARGTEPTVTR